MLVLTRAINDAIMIGDNIEIVVVSVKGDKVRIGIKAPGSVKVFRKEIYEEIREANLAASSGDVPQDALSELGAKLKGGQRRGGGAPESGGE